MNATQIAELIRREIDKQFNKISEKTFYRGVITAAHGVKANVALEGSSASLPNILCLSGYGPTVGDKVLVLSIGNTGTNFVVVGKIDENANSPYFPVGAGIPLFGTVIPDGWLIADGASINVKTYLNLFGVYGSTYGVGTTAKTFTVDASTNFATSTAHGYNNGDVIYVRSTTTLPGGLSAIYPYYVINKTTNTFQLSLEENGAIVDITSTGSGTHSSYKEFKIPNLKGRTVFGLDTSQAEFDTLGETGGQKTVQAHTHGPGTLRVLANVGNVANSQTNLDDFPGSAGPISATNQQVGHAMDGATASAGSGTNNLNPYLAAPWIIKY